MLILIWGQWDRAFLLVSMFCLYQTWARRLRPDVLVLALPWSVQVHSTWCKRVLGQKADGCLAHSESKTGLSTLTHASFHLKRSGLNESKFEVIRKKVRLLSRSLLWESLISKIQAFHSIKPRKAWLLAVTQIFLPKRTLMSRLVHRNLYYSNSNHPNWICDVTTH